MSVQQVHFYVTLDRLRRHHQLGRAGETDPQTADAFAARDRKERGEGKPVSRCTQIQESRLFVSILFRDLSALSLH